MRKRGSILTIKNNRSFVSRQLAPVTLLSIFSCLGDHAGSIISTIIVGGLYSETGLVVIGLMAPIVMLTVFICDIITGSGIYLRSIEIVEGNDDKAARYAGNSLLIVTLAGTIVSLIIFTFGDVYLSFFSLTPETYELALPYIRVIAFHSLLYSLVYYGYELVFRLEKKSSAILMVATASFGAAFLGLIFVSKLGLIGMAFAIIASDMLMIAIAAITIYMSRSELKFKFGFIKEELIEHLKYGFTYAQDSCYYPIYSALIFMFIGKMYGESCMAIFAIVECIAEFTNIFYGASYAEENYIGSYVGEGNYDGIKKLLKASAKNQFVIAVICTALCIIFAEPIAAYMGMENIYKADTIMAVRIYGCGLIPLAFACYLGDYYCDIKKYGAGVAINIGRILIAGLGINMLLGLSFGSMGIYVGKALEAVFGLCLCFVYIKCKYKGSNLFFLKDSDNIVSFDYEVTEGNVFAVRDIIEDELKARNISDERIHKVLIVFEEYSLLTLDNNNMKKVYAECALFFNSEGSDLVKMLIRDHGQIIDISNSDERVTSLRSYMISSMINRRFVRARHIIVASINRLELTYNALV